MKQYHKAKAASSKEQSGRRLRSGTPLLVWVNDEGRIRYSETKNVEKTDVMDQVRLELESGVCHEDV
ncbi:hypothetical protein CY34DRAFT_813582, partial [Suillus luteus UH-Slu-Lm8-n1]